MSELYCVICSKFVETEGMTLVQDFKTTTMFLDKKSGLAHEVERKSAKYRTKPKPVPQSIVVKKAPPPAPPPEVPAPVVVEDVEPQVLTEEPVQQVWVQEQVCEHTDPTYAVVIDWDAKGHFGNVERPCGCSLFVTINGVEYLQPGDPVWVNKIIRNELDTFGRDMGRYIRLVEEDTGDDDATD